MKSRLFRKFLLSFLLVGIAVFAFSSFILRGELRKTLISRFEQEMTAEGKTIAGMPIPQIVRDAGNLAVIAHSRLTLVDVSGKVLADTMSDAREMESHLDRSEMQEARLRGVGKSLRYSSTLKEDMLYVAVPHGEGGYVRLARPVTEIDLFTHEGGRVFLGLFFAIVAFYLLVAIYLSSGIFSSLRRLALFTGRVRAGDFSGSLIVQSRDEIGELYENINEMVGALREKISKADEARRKLESVFAGMDEGVMLLDAERRIESLNRSMERMIGVPAEEAVGRTILEICRNAELHDALKRALESGAGVCAEITVGDERPKEMDVTISLMNGETGGERKTILVFHDVTRLKRLEQVRTDFVANVTHEIRTPLTAIIGFAETLQQGALENREAAARFLDTIRENAERLSRLVDDLTTLSLFELGEARLSLEPLSLREVAEKALFVAGGRAAQKGIVVRRDMPDDLSLIFADRDRLMEILINIMDNAIKFTPAEGTITLSARPEGADFIRMDIADTGCGIPAAEIPRLGERFYRIDKTRSRELGGTGLGLSIVKHLMSAHGGRMTIVSAMGKGTTVSLFFPLSKPHSEQP